MSAPSVADARACLDEAAAYERAARLELERSEEALATVAPVARAVKEARDAVDVAGAVLRAAMRTREQAEVALAASERAASQAELDGLASRMDGVAARHDLATLAAARVDLVARQRSELADLDGRLAARAADQRAAVARARQLAADLDAPAPGHAPLPDPIVGVLIGVAAFEHAHRAGEPRDFGKHVEAIHRALHPGHGIGFDTVVDREIGDDWPLEAIHEALLAGTFEAEKLRRSRERDARHAAAVKAKREVEAKAAAALEAEIEARRDRIRYSSFHEEAGAA